MTPSQPSRPQRSPVEVWYLAKNFLTSETSLYIFKRILQALLTLFLASIFSFFVIQLSPGDFLDLYRQNPAISAETIQQLEEQFGLDEPILTQYFRWLWQVLAHFNFGTSFAYQRPVAEVLWERIPNTLLF
jgi:peptide/nickel transport system permease protein